MSRRTSIPKPARHNPDAPRKGPGVYTLEDIRSRCRVDDVTGCWHWAMAISDGGDNNGSRTPRVCVPAGVIAATSRCISVARVAWLMDTGRPLQQGQVVWRICGHDDCCAPPHLKVGTKAQEGAWHRAQGQWRGNPVRAATNMRSAMTSQAVPALTVAAVKQALDAGQLQIEAAAAFGLNRTTVSKIARGLHAHQRRHVAAASVFTLAGPVR